MKAARLIFGWLFLALWLPLTSHCLIERAGWLADSDCCASDTANATERHAPGEKICCSLASGVFNTQVTRKAPVTAPDAVAQPTGHVAPVLRIDTPVHAHAAAPPELATRWQFLHRAAPPVRAPARTT